MGSLLVGAGSAVAQNSAQKRAAKNNRAAANDALVATLGQLSLRGSQEALAAAQRRNEVTTQALSARGSLAAAAGYSNVAGNSVAAAEAEVMRAEAASRQVIDANLANVFQQLEASRRSAFVDRDARASGIQGPSNVALGLNILGAGIGAANDWLRMQPPKTT